MNVLNNKTFWQPLNFDALRLSVQYIKILMDISETQISYVNEQNWCANKWMID